MLVAHSQRGAEVGEAAGDGDPLLERPGRRDEDLRAPGEEGLHRLDPQPADLQVGLGLLVGKGLLLGIEVGLLHVVQHRLQVGLHGHGVLGRLGDHHEDALGVGPVERRDGDGPEGAHGASQAGPLPGGGERPGETRHRRGGADGVQHHVTRHGTPRKRKGGAWLRRSPEPRARARLSGR